MPSKKPLGTVARIAALETELSATKTLLRNFTYLLITTPRATAVKPLPGIDLAGYNLARYNQIHGIGPGNELSQYQYFTDPAYANDPMLAKDSDAKLFRAAHEANIVEKSAEGLATIIFGTGHGYAQLEEIVGPDDAKIVWAWFQAYNDTIKVVR